MIFFLKPGQEIFYFLLVRNEVSKFCGIFLSHGGVEVVVSFVGARFFLHRFYLRQQVVHSREFQDFELVCDGGELQLFEVLFIDVGGALFVGLVFPVELILVGLEGGELVIVFGVEEVGGGFGILGLGIHIIENDNI